MTTSHHYQERVLPFSADDGMMLNLIHIRGQRDSSRSPVLLVHGAGVRANIFRAPVSTTIVDALIEEGYDVWLENWRASSDLPPNRYTLDQAALYDHPAAVRKIVEETGAEKIKAIIHCQGSTSFAMSAVAGLVPQVETIVSNAVSLHPVVPWISQKKLKYATPIVEKLTPYLNPQWGLEARGLVQKMITGLVRLTHHECKNTVCRMVSFTYGTGFPTLWSHENLNDETHEWLKHEFKFVPLTFFRQIYRCVKKGHLVSVEGLPGLPDDFVAQPAQTDARFAFFSGENNICFLPESQRRSFEFMNQQRPDYHSLTIVPDYGHLDMFMGKNAGRDVFPVMLEELARTG